MSETSHVERFREVAGLRVPTFLYGTAWKEDATRPLVEQALAAGFRGIDTANQRKHYVEAGVGEALRAVFGRGELARRDVFLQTKFTHRGGQDHRLPYDADAPLATQVRQSFASSLEHLGVEAIDSYVLHGPTQRSGIGAADLEVWRAMESIHRDGGVRLLGVSNVTADQLDELCSLAQVQPAFVQSRCFADRRWDAAIRDVCARRGIVYQGFSLLTANGRGLSDPSVREIAERHGRTVPQVVFRFALQLGMIPLTGTTDVGHMAQDLDVYDFALTDGEVATLERVAG